jgi:hypothetical protein
LTIKELEEHVCEILPSQKVRSRKDSNKGRNVWNSVSPVHGDYFEGDNA